MFGIEERDGILSVYVNGKLVIRHSQEKPFLCMGKAKKPGGRPGKPLPLDSASYDAEHAYLRFSGSGFSMSFALSDNDGCLIMTAQRYTPGIGCLRMDFPAESNSRIYGGGEQKNAENLRGRRFGVYAGAGQSLLNNSLLAEFGQGFYHHKRACNPQPTFSVGGHVLYQIHTAFDCELDFRGKRRCRASVRGIPERIIIITDQKPSGVIKQMAAVMGTQPTMPQWCAGGAWLDILGGNQALEDSLSKAVSVGLKTSCVVLRDWSGNTETSLGRAPFWDLAPSHKLYPDLSRTVAELLNRGIRALAYINPCLSIEGRYFAEASSKGYLIRKKDGGAYVSDTNGVMAGRLDLTNPGSCEWFKQIIRTNILKSGFSGYIADMDLYLPDDAVLFDRSEPRNIRNRWPVLWAKLNQDAINGYKGGSDIALIMRSGCCGSVSYTPLAQTGAGSASWGTGGGLGAAFNASICLAWSGYGVTYSMIGGARKGLLTFDGRELMMRWSEYAAFTPIMHAAFGGKSRGVCVDEDVETLRHFSRMASVHDKLSPYINACVAGHVKSGMPVIRPIDMVYSKERGPLKAKGEYMLGPDLLVAPVLSRGRKDRSVVFPKGTWINLWSGKEYEEGEAHVPAPFGRPPVFFPSNSKYMNFFLSLKTNT